jgi:putative holliday junction resolvase
VVLAFDYGLRRVGVATANLHTRTATPLTTLAVGKDLPWAHLDALIDEWRPGVLVVGMPQGSEAAAAVAARVRRFVAALSERYGIPVETVDESLTSAAASAELREGRRSGLLRRRVQKDSVDRYAACHIAEQWLTGAPDDA